MTVVTGDRASVQVMSPRGWAVLVVSCGAVLGGATAAWAGPPTEEHRN